MDRQALYAFLASQRYGVLSSVSGDNAPQSALMGIAVTAELELIFDTLNNTRKYRNLIARPQCSFVIGWAGEQTVQLEGIAHELAGPELDRYQGQYLAAWPECVAHRQWPGIAYFVVRPTWIRFSDYGRTPPLIEELTIEATGST